MMVFLSIVFVVVSFVMVVMILSHKGSGDGISDMFGGGMVSTASEASSGQKNLTKFTIIVGILWAACVFGLVIVSSAS